MSQVDYIIGFAIFIGVLLFLISYTVTNFTNSTDMLEVTSLERSLDSTSNLILYSKDPQVGLSTDLNEVLILFEEIGEYEHSETLQITISGVGSASKPHVYDLSGNEVASQTEYKGKKAEINFHLHFLSSEKKKVKIIYSDEPGNSVSYTSNPTETNVTARIVSGSSVPAVSADRCYDLIGMDYEVVRGIVGSNLKIELENCNYGPDPSETNVIVKEKSVLMVENNGLAKSKIAKIFVW